VKRSPIRILTAVDEQFARIERLLKELRKRIADVAEDVRLAAEQIREAAPQKAPAKRASARR
jgi:hypothetical protein